MGEEGLHEDEVKCVACGLPAVWTVNAIGDRWKPAQRKAEAGSLLEANLGYTVRPCWVFMAQMHTLCSSLFPRSLRLPSDSLWITSACYHAHFM